MPAGMQAALFPYFKLCLFVEKPVLLRLNYCPVMRGNVFFHRLDFYPSRLPAFSFPTTTVMAFSVVEDIAAPVIGL
jgi:hypothetical protein